MYNFFIGLGLVIAVMLQLGIASRFPILSGTADLILLFIIAWTLHEKFRHPWIWTIIAGTFVSLISPMSLYMPLVTLLIITALVQFVKKHIWQSPLLVMLMITFVGTLIQHVLYMLTLQLIGTEINWSVGFYKIALPSLLFNMLLAIPVYSIIHELANYILPEGQEL